MIFGEVVGYHEKKLQRLDPAAQGHGIERHAIRCPAQAPGIARKLGHRHHPSLQLREAFGQRMGRLGQQAGHSHVAEPEADVLLGLAAARAQVPATGGVPAGGNRAQRPPGGVAGTLGIVSRGAGILSDQLLPLDDLQLRDMPLAGALAHEGVANRTLLIGPAGGFYSACTEDIYPNCWSALFAAESIRKALKERHLQDALQPYRSRWRTTLGQYLRGPQQNFRFLLPFIYRNQVMTTRLTESILLGKSVVR